MSPQMDEQDARDLLIRVDEQVKFIHEDILKYRSENAGEHQTMTNSIKKAHERIDDIGSLKDKILGAVAVIGMLISLTMFILVYIKQ